MERSGQKANKTTQPAIKKRFERCKVRVLNSLLLNYTIVYPAPDDSPFDYTAIDKNGIKYIRVEMNELSDTIKEAIIEYKKNCPPNTICEVQIFYKHAKVPVRMFF